MKDADLHIVLGAVQEPVLLVDRFQRIVHGNAPALEMFGPDLEGKTFVRVLRQPAALKCLSQVVDGKARAEADLIIQGEQSVQSLPYKMTAVHLGSDDPAIAITFKDVSALVQAAQMRSDFVANVSHELRSPLTTLSGMIETLMGNARDDPEAQQRFLKIMEREASRMDRLIGDLLSLSRVEADERIRPTDSVDLVEIIFNVLASMRERAEGEDRTLAFEPAAERCIVSGKADELTQVFQNLIENSVKYSKPGGFVEVRVEWQRTAPRFLTPVWAISVRDEGEGIAPEHIPRLQERFYRVDSGRSRQMGGTGLGLAIVKHILNRHRGRLNIESQLGAGTTMTVLLPASLQHAPSVLRGEFDQQPVR
ncbi:MAG: ATP-binding protein [Pseudomonadota bacterium]